MYSGNILTFVPPTHFTQSLSSLRMLESDIHHRCFWHLAGHMEPWWDPYSVHSYDVRLLNDFSFPPTSVLIVVSLLWREPGWCRFLCPLLYSTVAVLLKPANVAGSSFANRSMTQVTTTEWATIPPYIMASSS